MTKKLFIIMFLLVYKISAQDVCITNLEKEVLAEINKYRKSKGLSALSVSKVLTIVANKNAEAVVKKTNKTYTPSEFGKYYATTQSFRLSISGTNSVEISRSLQNDASRAELLSKADWQVLGISIRKNATEWTPTTISLVFGNKSDEAFNPSECADSQVFFNIEAKDPNATPKRTYVKFKNKGEYLSVTPFYTKEGKRVQLGESDLYSLDAPKIGINEVWFNTDGVETFELHIKPLYTNIVAEDQFVNTIIKLNKNQWVNKDTLWINFELKGNSLQEVKAHLAKNPTGMNVKTGFGRRNMLHRAVWRNNLEVVQFLIEEKKMNINELSDDKEHIMGLVVSDEMFEYLISKKPQLVNRYMGFTILHQLSANGVLKGVKYMIEVYKADINDPANIHKTTPLMSAVIKNRIAVAEYLLQKGAKIHDNSWNTHILYEAVFNNNTDMVMILLRYKTQALIDISPNAESNNKPLHKAIVANNLAIVKLLVENGADLSKENYVAFAKDYSWIDKNLIEYLKSKGSKY